MHAQNEPEIALRSSFATSPAALLSPRADNVEGVFVCGRQHSGNTMLAALLGRIDGVLATLNEGILLEHHVRLDKLPDAVARARWMNEHLEVAQPHLKAELAHDLIDWAGQHPHTSAIDLFQKRCALETTAAGKKSWARKATSYIFHADTILRRMPNVRLIYLLRNPFDLCASMKRRNGHREHIVGSALSWSRGAELALRFEKEFPDRVHVICYEKLVTDPEPTIKRLCQFLDKPYDPSLLDVPVINTSDQPYKMEEGRRGLSTSHIYYYKQQLTAAEIIATSMLCPRGILRRVYPELPHLSQRRSWIATLGAICLIASGLLRYPLAAIRQSRRNALPFRDYILRRMKVLLKIGTSQTFAHDSLPDDHRISCPAIPPLESAVLDHV